MDRRFEGKVAVITGGGGGIGRATAVRLAGEGARIAAVDVSKPGLAETVAAVERAGGQAIALEADVTRDADVERYVWAAREQLGRVDAFFNNAGILGETKPITDYSEATFDRVIAINLKGVWLGLKHVGAAMKAQGGGAIVNTASIAGLTGTPGLVAYTASKHAVVGMTRTAAMEFSRHGIDPSQRHLPRPHRHAHDAGIARTPQHPRRRRGQAEDDGHDPDAPVRRAGRGGRTRGLPLELRRELRQRRTLHRRRRRHGLIQHIETNRRRQWGR
jgi:NAD(P)-dependent dehydrogenase (short-subunit alcohol dehydrogenase family)